MIELLIGAVAFAVGFYLRGTALGKQAANKMTTMGGGGPAEE